jgi:hypothetical protein
MCVPRGHCCMNVLLHQENEILLCETLWFLVPSTNLFLQMYLTSAQQ